MLLEVATGDKKAYMELGYLPVTRKALRSFWLNQLTMRSQRGNAEEPGEKAGMAAAGRFSGAHGRGRRVSHHSVSAHKTLLSSEVSLHTFIEADTIESHVLPIYTEDAGDISKRRNQDNVQCPLFHCWDMYCFLMESSLYFSI